MIRCSVRSRTQEPSFSHSRARFGWRTGTFNPSRRHSHSTRLSLTSHLAFRSRAGDRTGFLEGRLGTLSRTRRKSLVQRDHPQASLRLQCRLLGAARSLLPMVPVGA